MRKCKTSGSLPLFRFTVFAFNLKKVWFLNDNSREKLQEQFNIRICKNGILAACNYSLQNQLTFSNSIALYEEQRCLNNADHQIKRK